MKRFIVVGLGNFGSAVAEALFEKGHEVLAVDTSPDRVDQIAAHTTRAAVGDGTRIDVLERLGVAGSEAGVVSTGDDIAASVLATMALRDIGVTELYVKVASPEHARIMVKFGVTEVIFPERESALNLSQRIVQSESLLRYVQLDAGFAMQEMAVPNKWTGKTLRELDLRRRYRLSVIAIQDVLTDSFKTAPDPDEPLTDSEVLLVAGMEEDLSKVADIK